MNKRVLVLREMAAYDCGVEMYWMGYSREACPFSAVLNVDNWREGWDNAQKEDMN